MHITYIMLSFLFSFNAEKPIEFIKKMEVENKINNKTYEYSFCKNIRRKNILTESVQKFGAKGDGTTDDTQAIIRALNSKVDIILFPKTKKYYKYTGLIIIRHVYNKKIVATGAKILNSDLSKACILFEDSQNLIIEGGQYGYLNTPKSNGGNSQHVIQFNKCQNVVVNKVHISNSPEMGVAVTNCNNVTVKNSLIENTFRDGTYAHYSSNIKYLNNVYSNIKDDAMSFHDYGIKSEKLDLKNYGYPQSTNCLASGNLVVKAYQGFSSIGSSTVIVKNNTFRNIVLAGVAIFNSKELYIGGTAYVNSISVIENNIFNACSKIVISDSLYINTGQASTGRASIFVGSLGDNNQINSGESKKLYNITVKGNRVENSGAHGLLCKDIDTLQVINNQFVNCSGSNEKKSLSGDVVEISSVTNFWADNNKIIDSRKKTQHQHGYTLVNVSGRMKNWYIKGYLSTKGTLYGLKPIDTTKLKN